MRWQELVPRTLITWRPRTQHFNASTRLSKTHSLYGGHPEYTTRDTGHHHTRPSENNVLGTKKRLLSRYLLNSAQCRGMRRSDSRAYTMKIAGDLTYKPRDLFVGVELPLTEGASQVLIYQLPRDGGPR